MSPELLTHYEYTLRTVSLSEASSPPCQGFQAVWGALQRPLHWCGSGATATAAFSTQFQSVVAIIFAATGEAEEKKRARLCILPVWGATLKQAGKSTRHTRAKRRRKKTTPAHCTATTAPPTNKKYELPGSPGWWWRTDSRTSRECQPGQPTKAFSRLAHHPQTHHITLPPYPNCSPTSHRVAPGSPSRRATGSSARASVGSVGWKGSVGREGWENHPKSQQSAVMTVTPPTAKPIQTVRSSRRSGHCGQGNLSRARSKAGKGKPFRRARQASDKPDKLPQQASDKP